MNIAAASSLAVLLVGSTLQRPADIVRWSVKSATAMVQPGGTVTVRLGADIEDGWHLYALSQPAGGPSPLSIAPGKDGAFTLKPGSIDAPPPFVAADPNFSVETHYYEGSVELSVPLAAPRDIKEGSRDIPLDVTFQACSNRLCLRPFTETLSIPVTVTKGKPR